LNALFNNLLHIKSKLCQNNKVVHVQHLAPGCQRHFWEVG